MNRKIKWHNENEMVNLRSVIETLCYMVNDDSDGVEEIMQLPTIDIIHCKDCAKVKESGGHANCNGWLTCQYTGKTVDEDDYCSKGERA